MLFEQTNPKCPLAKTENFTSASLGMLTAEQKDKLQRHVIDDSCQDCIDLWLTVSSVIESVQASDIQKSFQGCSSKPDKVNTEEKISRLEEKIDILENKHGFLTGQIKKVYQLLIFVCLLIFGVLALCFYPANLNQDGLTISPITTPGLNFYDSLDKSIDTYLLTKDKEELRKAYRYAKEIKDKYNDFYGVDTVSYYSGLTSEKCLELLQLRQELRSLTERMVKEDPRSFLTKTNELYRNFLLANALIEAYKTKIILLKYYSLTSDSKNIEYSTEELLTWTTNNNYLYLKLQTLLWQAKDPKEPNPISALENVFNLAVRLDLFDIQVSSSTSLAAFYVNRQENQKALQLAETILKAETLKYTHKATLLQIKGMAYFNLKDYKNSRLYLERAVSISKENDDSFLITLSYSFLGTVLAQSGEYAESETALNNAQDAVSKVKDPSHKAELESRVLGYQAKKEFLQGNYVKSANLYNQSIDRIETAKLENSASLAELNQGLGMALKKIGSKKHIEHSRIASYYAKQTGLPKEAFSCILSFIPRCS